MDNVKYVNHLGETLDLRSSKIMSSYEALKSFVQSMTNNGLTSEGKTTALPVICLSVESANKLIDTLEKDSISNKYGRFYINDWYIKLIYQGMKPVKRYGSKIKLELSFYAEDTVFTKETAYQLLPTSEVEEEYLNFPFDFDFDLGSDKVSVASIINNELLDADFVLKFSASVSSFDISIGTNSYIVDAAVNEDETFTLDTDEKEVYKESYRGKTNLFGAADDTSYIFNTLSHGTHIVTWAGEYPIALTVLEHRRTPPWI